MTRATAIATARSALSSGAFLAELSDLVALNTDSQTTPDAPALTQYLTDGVGPILTRMGFAQRILPNPAPGHGPILIAHRFEGPDQPSVLTYGHGDTVPPMAGRWAQGRDPLRLAPEGDRIYGRGTADNKGQHLVNLTALEAVLEVRGRLGFNITLLLEMGEEQGSPGLHALAADQADRLAADVLIASDGPRLAADHPTLFTGARGGLSFDLSVDLRDGAHHSGNWGGLLADPAQILARAIASLTTPEGALAVPEWRPDSLTDPVRAALARLDPITPHPGDPAIDPDWGELGLTPTERVLGWNSFAVLAMGSGDLDQPVNAIQPRARARCQLRYVVGTDADQIVPGLRRHLDREGLQVVTVTEVDGARFAATRMAPGDPWVRWAEASIARTTGAAPALMPNLGGSLPNDVFADVLGLPTIWVPHSYPGCGQHAPGEHALTAILDDGLAIMAGIWWDLGEGTPDYRVSRIT